ncbi:MAG: glycosyltransferase [bacterium]
MELVWINHQINIVIFLFVILIITISNYYILINISRFKRLSQFPSVSILVPARNEEKNIAYCLNSLLNQDYPNFQVHVLDDNSSDNTWEIITELASNNKRLIIHKGKPLPYDWIGKHWACYQLAEKADSEILLFTDADTYHYPETLSNAISALEELNADLITAFPREHVITWGERLMVPLFPWFIISFLPLIVAYRVQSPAFSAGIGQFMLFRRKAYDAIGGYSAIKQEVVDDVALARKIKANGFRWRMINGIDRISCRMYVGFKEAYKGFAKNLFAGFGYHILKFSFIWIWIGIAFLQPIIVLFMNISGYYANKISLALSSLGIAFSLLIWFFSNLKFRFPLYLTLLYPINIILAIFIAFGSMIITLTGKAGWKGRKFIKPKIRWW